jgi:LuxR family transcriptional regulator, maltose regulon positive regulatory protein
MTGTGEVYAFRSFRVDPARRLLLRDGCPVSVTAKLFDLLIVLIRSRERVVTRAELMQELWPDTTVEDGNLSVGISALRKALGSGSDDAPIIETLPRVGYRFVADVRQESPGAAQRENMPSEPPVARRAETGALSLNLPAKVLCPDAGGAILRERLFHALDERSQSPITWLHAPAGSGKTTLLSSYLRARQVPMLWYDVDAGDADASSIFHYTRLAAQALLGAEVELPVPRPGPPAGQRVFARRFFEALFRQLPHGTHLVFDNYQDAASEPAHNDMFRELCSAVTPRVRILVGSRVAPPPALARFGASGQMQFLTSHDLRLDEEEVQHLLSRKGGPSPNGARDSARLMELTDGWAVAIALLAKASLAPTHRAQPALGSREDDLQSIFDFLAGEVFEGLEAPTRELLLEVALLPSFTAAMAVELTGRRDAAVLLSKLHLEYLLVERHGENSFRLHDLLRMFLVERGTRTRDEKTHLEICERAATLLAESDQFPAAIELLAGCRSWITLGDLVERYAPVLASQGRLATLGAALELLPAPVRDGRPWLVYWRAVFLLGHAGGMAQALAETAFHAFRAAGDTPGLLMSWSLLVHAIVTGGDDLHPLDGWLTLLDEMAVAPPSPAIAAQLELSKVVAHFFRHTPRALEVADAALPTVIRHGTPDEALLVGGYANTVYLFAGDPERARDVQHLLVELTPRASDPFARIIYLFGEALRALVTGRPRIAWRIAEQGLALAEDSGVHSWDCWLFFAGAISSIGLRELTAAESMADAITRGPENQHHFAHCLQAAARGCLSLEREDIDDARRWNREATRLCERIGFPVGRVASATIRIIVEASAGDAVAVRRAITELDACLGPRPTAFHSLAGSLAKTYASLCRGERADAGLRDALLRGRDCGYGVFVGSRVVKRLVSAAFEYGIEVEHARELQQDYELEPTQA